MIGSAIWDLPVSGRWLGRLRSSVLKLVTRVRQYLSTFRSVSLADCTCYRKHFSILHADTSTSCAWCQLKPSALAVCQAVPSHVPMQLLRSLSIWPASVKLPDYVKFSTCCFTTSIKPQAGFQMHLLIPASRLQRFVIGSRCP